MILIMSPSRKLTLALSYLDSVADDLSICDKFSASQVRTYINALKCVRSRRPDLLGKSYNISYDKRDRQN